MISIIVPVYNAEKTLERCIKSLEVQTYFDIEILLIDDGSTDKSGKICDDFVMKDERIRVLHLKNGGVSKARNIGIMNAQGDYIMFCDSDDYVQQDWCKELYETICANATSFVLCEYFLNTKGMISYHTNSKTTRAVYALDDFWRLFTEVLIGQPWNKIYDKKIITDYNIKFQEDISLGEDIRFNLEYLSHCNKIVKVNNELYYYSVGNEFGLSNKWYPNYFELQCELYDLIKKFIQKYTNVWEKEKNEFFQYEFYTYEQAFENNWKCKSDTWWSVICKNQRIMQSERFQEAKKFVNINTINKLQYVGLQTNCYFIYWLTVGVSRRVSYFMKVLKNDKK